MKSTCLSAVLLAANLVFNLHAAEDTTAINTLTEAEKAAGWKLLFNGHDTTGWHNFKSDSIRPGWQIKDGVLTCAVKTNSGDIVTSEKFDWFELQLDYNITPHGNSGIMIHVTDDGKKVFETGPEFQLLDNPAYENAKPAAGAHHEAQLTGWLYQLYQPDIDPKTGKPIDATKPAGEWNHVRLLITPEKCVHEVNGVKYLEYVYGSDDFKQRAAKSKFAKFPFFGKSNIGYIAIQGDHGVCSFRNIKIRPIAAPDSAK